MFKIFRKSFENTFESVDNALRQAKLNDTDVVLVIFDEEFPIKKTDTHDTLVPLKKILRIKGRLATLKDKGIA